MIRTSVDSKQFYTQVMATGDTDDPKTPSPGKTPDHKSDQASTDEQAAQSPPPKPGPTKIPEQPGNLRRREDYFRKRS